MAILLTNLSNGLYGESRLRLNASAERFGIDGIRSWDWEDLKSTEFYRDNSAILDLPTGMGYWLWKPYIILEALRNAAEGDIVVYCDSGLEIIAPLDPLLTICRNGNPIVLFGNGNFPNSMWTKRDCFILMNADGEEDWMAPQCDAAFCLFLKGEVSVSFVTEWLGWCRDARILTDNANRCGRRNLPDFIEHRRDQSVLSLMARKYHIPLFRMPTQFGNHYKTYPFRIPGEFNCVNQYYQRQAGHYALIPYYNSPYFQLLDHHRGMNKGATGPGSLRHNPFSYVLRIVRKRYNRWLNTLDLWRHKTPR
jgi:hypothetical protein